LLSVIVIAVTFGLYLFQSKIILPPISNSSTSPISFITSSSIITQTKSTDTTKTYTNTEFGFEFNYPSDWTFTSGTFGSQGSKFNLVGASPEENGIPFPIDPSILINVITPDFGKNILRTVQTLNPTTSSVAVSNMQETKYIYPFENEFLIDIVIPINPSTTIILGARKTYEKTFDQILESFRLLGK
jgi:hypothetical protein